MARPHRGTYRGTNYSKSKNKNLPKKVDEEKKVDNNIEMKQPSMIDNIKGGFGFGVGSSIAHSAIASLSSMVGSKGGSIGEDNKKIEGCTGILKKYIDCLQLYNYNDIQPECIEIKKMIETMNCNK